MLGYRDLVPELRQQPNLTFDVMPLPKLSSGATIATMSGLCISSKSQHTDEAADFLTAVISDPGAATLAKTGYVMPANLDVVNGEDFLQTGQRPLHSGVFTREVRDSRLLPSDPQWPTVRRATARDLTELFYEPVILPLQERLEAIDEASITMFDPSKATPSADPSASPSSTP
jgi:multiple sugar transport system substrate-binding protein